MASFLVLFVLILIILLLVVAGLGIKMLLSKDGEFKGGCAANNPMLTNEIGECGVCGSKPGEDCKGEENIVPSS